MNEQIAQSGMVMAIRVEGRAQYQWTRLAMSGNSYYTENVAKIEGIHGDGWLTLAMFQRPLNRNREAWTLTY